MVSRPALQLAFLAIAGERPAVRGAVLVTDQRTVPLEFRVTEPVTPPTPMQRTLYGRTLAAHVAIDLLALPLLRALREQVGLVLVADPELLRLQGRLQVPVLWLGREADLVPMPDADEPGFLLTPAGGRGDPVVAVGYRGWHESTRGACERLQRLLEEHDLLEPFARLHQAVRQLGDGAAVEAS